MSLERAILTLENGKRVTIVGLRPTICKFDRKSFGEDCYRCKFREVCDIVIDEPVLDYNI